VLVADQIKAKERHNIFGADRTQHQVVEWCWWWCRHTLRAPDPEAAGLRIASAAAPPAARSGVATRTSCSLRFFLRLASDTSAVGGLVPASCRTHESDRSSKDRFCNEQHDETYN
jgi:hypothetical protein